MNITATYGAYDYEKEYTQIQKNIKEYWVASTKEDKLNAYVKFKTAAAIYKIKKKINVIDFAASNDTGSSSPFALKKSGIMLMQEHLQSINLIDKIINMNAAEMIDDILELFPLQEINDAYKIYSEGRL